MVGVRQGFGIQGRSDQNSGIGKKTTCRKCFLALEEENQEETDGHETVFDSSYPWCILRLFSYSNFSVRSSLDNYYSQQRRTTKICISCGCSMSSTYGRPFMAFVA